jgi:hypothetical protein
VTPFQQQWHLYLAGQLWLARPYFERLTCTRERASQLHLRLALQLVTKQSNPKL